MADFSSLSDTDEAAVQEILSEAADYVALKQISAINLSGVSDSVLPQNLESRFRRLKTFPSAAPPLPNGSSSAPGSSRSPEVRPKPTPAEKKSPSGSESSYSWLETNNSPKSDPRSRSVSPPTKSAGCLWCSPKKAVKKMSFSKRSGADWGRSDGVLNDLGVGSLSRRDQEKVLKRAVKEEMNINKEADKIVKLAHQLSARMDSFGLQDDDHLRYK